MAKRAITAGQASLLLSKYEALNSDIPKHERQQLALFVLAGHCTKAALEGLYERPLGTTPWVHRSWMWHTAMQLSGLGHHWDDFAYYRNDGYPMSQCLQILRRLASTDQWRLLSDRLGTAIFNSRHRLIHPSRWPATGNRKNVWTRGGVWDRRNPYTRIIVLGESLERDYSYSKISRALGEQGAKQLEREIHNTVDEEQLLYPDAICRAVDYARYRIPQMTGHPKAGLTTLPWFFQAMVPRGDRLEDAYRRTYNTLVWFPKEK